jgi:cysteinyl-tRNA synthetase
MTLLGEHFDIHTGGIDHRELHHVNEIAQSEAYLEDGRPWVPYWLHNEWVLLDAQKIAKSAGHTLRLADLTESGYHPMAYRLFLLGGHYRSSLDFTMAAMDGTQATLRHLVSRVAPLRPFPRVETLAAARSLLGVPVDAAGTVVHPAGTVVHPAGTAVGGEPAVPDTVDVKTALAYLDAIDAAISSDLATPRLLATLQDALKDRGFTPDGLRVVVAAADALLGLRLDNLELAEVEQRRAAEELTPQEAQEIERLIEERTQARAEKNWPRADEIRAELDALNVQVTDTPSGPTWQLR